MKSFPQPGSALQSRGPADSSTEAVQEKNAVIGELHPFPAFAER